MAKATPSAEPGRWLLLQVQLPSGRSTARVGIWRRLRKLGAVALGATWTLPLDDENRESFEWLRRDIEAGGGESLLFEARPVDAAVAAALSRRRQGDEATGDAERRPSALSPLDRSGYRGKVWVTRPRPGVDRMASAWLLRHFVDADARFEFADEPVAGADGRIPFDAFGAELGHQEGLCTFEVLAVRFAIDDPAVRRIGRVVHAVDLHEIAPDDSESAMVARLVAGLRASHVDDAALLEAGIALIEALYASAEAEARPRRSIERAAETPKRPTKRRKRR